jgi:hypothetical protein
MKDVTAVKDTTPAFPYKYSFIDTAGKVVIDAGKYQGVGSFSDGLASVWLVNRGWGFIDRTGKVIIEPHFESVPGFSEELAGVKVAGKWGFIDKAGNIIIEPQYESVNSFSEGVAVVVKRTPKQASRLPIKDPIVKGESIRSEVVGSTNSSVGDPPIDLMQVGVKEVLLINRTGQTILSYGQNEVVQINYHEIAKFSEGLIDIFDHKKNKVGFMDKTGTVVIEPTFDQASPFSEGLARVAVVKDGVEKVGFIDHHGQFVIPPKFNTDEDFRRNSTDFSEGLASLTENLNPTITEEEKFVYVDKKGAIVIFTDFFWAGPFRDGLAVVYDPDSGKSGFIDKSGEIVIPLQYDLAYDFSSGLSCVAIRSN